MYKKHQIIMLPTKTTTENSLLLIPEMEHNGNNGKSWLKTNKDITEYQPKLLKPHHLYILSDDEIKELPK